MTFTPAPYPPYTNNGGGGGGALGVVEPSGDITGVSDTANFNRSLTLYNAAIGVAGQTYYFNNPVILPSHSEMDMTGCTVIQPTGTLINVLRNHAVAATRTTTDAQGLAGSSSLVSLTAKFTTADTGSTMGVVGGAAGGATWYGNITAPVTSSTATAWVATTAAGLGAFIRPRVANGLLYWATTAGTTGSTEPAWPTNVGGTVTDGSVVWTCLGAATGVSITQTVFNGNNTACTCDVSVTGAALSVFGNRDSDITVHGGTWFFCDQTYYAGGPFPTPLNNQPTCFRRVDGFRIYDMRITQAGPAGLGGRICVSAADAAEAHAWDITFLTTCAGLQFDAPMFNATIRDITGSTGDDMVALSTEDDSATGPANGYLRDTQGNVGGIDVDNIVGVTIKSVPCWNLFKLYGLGTVNRKFSMTQIRVKGIRGTVSASGRGAAIINSPAVNMDDVVFSDITCVPLSSNPIVYVQATYYTNLLIDNVVWNGASPATTGIVNLQLPRGEVKVSRLRMTTAPAGTNYGLYLTLIVAPLSGSSFGAGITLDGVYVAPANGLPPAAFTPFYFTTGLSAGTLPYLHVNNAYVAPTTSGYLVQLATALGIADLDISNVKASGLTALVAGVTGTAPIVARLTNVSATATNLFAVSCPLTVEATNVDVTTSGAVFALSNADSTPNSMKLANFSQSGAGALYSVSTGAAVPTMSGSPNLQSGSAALTTGSSGSIAVPLLTATGLIRVTNIAAGGTLGVLSVAIVAGTGFTINSSSALDSSTIYWEVVQY